MKRIFAVLSVSLLLAATMLGYAECWMRSSEACKPKPPSCGSCSSETQPAAPSVSRVCVGNVQCEPREVSCESTDSECYSACAPDKECGPMVCRLSTVLVADGPNKTISTTIFPIESQLPVEHLAPLPESRNQVPETLPPWGVHPIIQTTILRI